MATFGKGVEYALHCLAYLVDRPGNKVLTVSDIARFQGISESYLAKIFTKLTKAGLTRSSIGAKGGYELTRSPELISFWDVVVAVEGKPKLFECRNVRAGCVLYRDDKEKPKWLVAGICEIHKVMLDAEAQLQRSLQAKNLGWLTREVGKKIPKEEAKKFDLWFLEATESRK